MCGVIVSLYGVCVCMGLCVAECVFMVCFVVVCWCVCVICGVCRILFVLVCQWMCVLFWCVWMCVLLVFGVCDMFESMC